MKTLFLLALVTSSIFADSGNLHALKIAEGSKSVLHSFKELKDKVKQIKISRDIPESLKSTSLLLLSEKESLAFKFLVAARLSQETEIVKELNSKLSPLMNGKPAFEASETATEKSPLFPTHAVMAFLAAPGSADKGHHAYPGGLVHHTYTNVLSALRLADTYEKVYQTKFPQSEKDLAVLAALWHDAAKTWVLNWKENGLLTTKEGKIAGTSAHHIWVLAELAFREMPADFIVTVAGAHDAIIPAEPSEQKVIGYLLAASILSGKALSQVGLTEKDGKFQLTNAPRLSHYLNHLSDADWACSVPAEKKAFEVLNINPESLGDARWAKLALLSSKGEIPLYQLWKTNGEQALKKLLQK